MDRLEQQLRDLLTDERLDLPLVPGAVTAVHDGVRRRKRRNAVLSVTASVVLVTAGALGGVVALNGGRDTIRPGVTNPPDTSSSPGISKPTKPPTRHAGNVIDWAAIPYDAKKPLVLAGTTPDPSVPWCTAAQLSGTATFQGATGNMAGPVDVVNKGADCGLQGTPVVTGYDDKNHAITQSTPVDSFLVHPWFVLRAGRHAIAPLIIFGDSSKCLGAITRLSVDLGHGGAALSIDTSSLNGQSVQPRCGTAPAAQQADHYTVTADSWQKPNGSPRLPMSDISALMGHQSTVQMQGTTLRYQVLLSTNGQRVAPCLPFREQLVTLDGTMTVAASETYYLDCKAINANPFPSYVLDMELHVPRDVAPGTYALQWETPIPGQSAEEGQNVRITAAPPRCTDQQVRFAPGRTGVGAGSYYDAIVITNTSARTCSVYGYPGVEFVDGAGHGVSTRDIRDGSRPPETVVLAPGAVASFVISGSDFAPPAGSASCPPTTGVHVIVPEGYVRAFVPQVAANCSSGTIRVFPVRPGRNARP